ncbi:MAG: hypothetical protein GX275_03165 [Clostridiales bacterium]|nr:hypothetical protein [Clostridiales bacterium]
MLNFIRKVKKIFNKIVCKWRIISDKYKELASVLTIVGVMLFAVVFIFLCKGESSDNQANQVVDIAQNKAESYYYLREYDKAIQEYKDLQKQEEWPIYKVKIAEIESVRGQTELSNSMLEEIVSIRNSLILNEGKEKYADKDAELGNYVAFTALMNGDYKKALEYGEFFISEDPDDKALQRTMFTIYMVNNLKEEAKGIVNNYPYDNESSYDLALYAKMNMLLDDWDKGLELLKEAWYLNKDEIKVFDVIAQINAYNSNDIISKIMELHEKNPDEVCYKIWLIKCYSMLEATTPQAVELLNEIENEDVGETVFKTIIAKIKQHEGDDTETEKIIKEIISNKNETYIGYHTAAWYYLEKGDGKKALEYCKRSILENKDYPDNYGSLIPDIMAMLKKSEVAEPYFRTALYKEPFNYNIMLKVADYYQNTESNSDEAYSYFSLASLVKPNDANIYYNMALININNDVNKAIELLKKCIELDETSTKYHRTLGTIYINEGKTEEGIKEIRAAYAVDKSDILTLNNAGVYYISMDTNIDRGMINLKAAYDGMNETTDIDTRNVITDNYNKAKDIYEAYHKYDGSKITIPEFQLFY